MTTLWILVAFALMLFLPCAFALFGDSDSTEEATAYSDRTIAAEQAAVGIVRVPTNQKAAELRTVQESRHWHQERIRVDERAALVAQASAARANAIALAADARLATAKAEAAEAEAGSAEDAAVASKERYRAA